MVTEIRLGRVEDAPDIATLGSNVFSESFGYSMKPDDLEHYLREHYNVDRIRAEISNPGIHFVVAVSNEAVVGFAQLTEGTTEDCISSVESPVELQRLYVQPSQHGTGLAKKLFESVQSIARDRKFKVLWLGVWEENYKAQKFYEKMGLARVGEHDFTMGSCVQTDWILQKAL